jgi:hypothetical protein
MSLQLAIINPLPLHPRQGKGQGIGGNYNRLIAVWYEETGTSRYCYPFRH